MILVGGRLCLFFCQAHHRACPESLNKLGIDSVEAAGSSLIRADHWPKQQTVYEEVDMSFKVLFLAHAPDADEEKRRSVIETGRYQLPTGVITPF